jgi:energy-coupling factor transporter ATP-binding protein EcfA2
VENLTWRPAGRREPVLARLDVHIDAGERVLLAGPSGAGKSTLLRAIAGLLLTADVGDLSGRVSVDGRAPQERPGQVGLLLQDPTAAIVADRVGRDVAFGLENTGVPRAEMPQRVRRALALAGFPYDQERRTGTLSGGETQRLALAGALALDPRVLLLDEPTAMLDEENAERVRRSVLDACAEAGTTLVVVEHRMGPWVEHMDRCLVLDADGEMVADGKPTEVLTQHEGLLAGGGIWVPGLPAPAPLAVDSELVRPHPDVTGAGTLVTAHEVTVRYGSVFTRVRRGEPGVTALSEVSCAVQHGRSLVLHGSSGAGKSTLLSVLAGLQQPDAGSVLLRPDLAGRKGREVSRLGSKELAARLAWVPQLPEHGLVRRTVLDELLVTARALGRPVLQAEERARHLLDVLGLGHLHSASSHHLSGGEQRRLVVAAALVHGPAGLLLDEPTVGQDRNTWAAITGLCLATLGAGAALAMASHDRDATEVLGVPAVGSVLEMRDGRTA